MRTDIIEYLEKEIKSRCESENNFFGMGCYYHIRSVVRNAAYLAQQYGADEEVVVIAAWLHDIASVTDYSLYEEHHIHGAKMAEEILRQFDYDENKVELVKKCILNHRGSRLMTKKSAEEICVADADAISHFDDVPSLFYLAYRNKRLDIAHGSDFVKGKLERSYNKLSDKSRQMYKKKYESVMMLFAS